eukprot:SAG11_NODE_4173_length_2027_cov_4.881224_2_plen_189_part_00
MQCTSQPRGGCRRYLRRRREPQTQSRSTVWISTGGGWALASDSPQRRRPRRKARKRRRRARSDPASRRPTRRPQPARRRRGATPSPRSRSCSSNRSAAAAGRPRRGGVRGETDPPSRCSPTTKRRTSEACVRRATRRTHKRAPGRRVLAAALYFEHLLALHRRDQNSAAQRGCRFGPEAGRGRAGRLH